MPVDTKVVAVVSSIIITLKLLHQTIPPADFLLILLNHVRMSKNKIKDGVFRADYELPSVLQSVQLRRQNPHCQAVLTADIYKSKKNLMSAPQEKIYCVCSY